RRLVPVVAVNRDGDERGVFNRGELETLLENFHRLAALQRLTGKIFFTPLNIQLDLVYDRIENHLRLDDFKGRLDEIRIVGRLAGDGRRVGFDFDARPAGIAFRQDERDDNAHQQHH